MSVAGGRAAAVDASSGLGRAIAGAALRAGDTVVATARRPETLLEHPPLRLPLGADAADAITARLDGDRADIAAWESVIRGTDLDR